MYKRQSAVGIFVLSLFLNSPATLAEHYWSYGNMPAQKGVGFSEMAGIVQFVREVQQQNGIVQKKHKM